ncbi:MAG: penicillin-binding protein 2 [Phycisphaerales bacterium]|nr:penicillin-binding protein 2 [Phycisphaerales bacterium]
MNARSDRVGFWFAIGCSIAMLLVLGRVVQLQIAPSARLVEVMNSRTSRSTVTGVRGDIVDRRGRLLANTHVGYRVFVDPLRLPEDPDPTIATLARILGIDPMQVGEPIIRRLAYNEQHAAGHGVDARGNPLVSTPDDPSLADVVEELFGGTPEPEPDPLEGVPPLSRYVRVSGILDDRQVEAIRAAKLEGVHLEERRVRTYPGGDLVAPLVGVVDWKHDGALGIERHLDQTLQARDGAIRYVRDHKGRPLWVEPGNWEPAQRGSTRQLSIDLEIQRIAYDELARGVEEADAAGGRLVAIDPDTGEVLAMADIIRNVPDLVEFPWVPEDAKGELALYRAAAPWTRYRTIGTDDKRATFPALSRNRCVEDLYEPGSTFKPFIWSIATLRGYADPDEILDTEGGRWRTPCNRLIEDVTKRDRMTWAEVLVNSSNIGMIKVAHRIGFDELRQSIGLFGFGTSTHLGLPGESSGILTPASRWSVYSQTSVSFGNEVAVTPVQMVRAFACFARSGDRAGTIPQLTLTTRLAPSDMVVERVLPSDLAIEVRHILKQVAANMEATFARKIKQDQTGESTDWKYVIFGKSGTAQAPLVDAPKGMKRPRRAPGYYPNQYNSSFIAAGPIERPALVVLVVIDDPGPDRVRMKDHYGSRVAGPVVRRFMDRALAYMGVPESPTGDEDDASLASGAREALLDGGLRPVSHRSGW